MQKPKAEQLRLWALVGVLSVLAVIVLVQVLGGRSGSGGVAEDDRVVYAGNDLPELELDPRPEVDPAAAEFRRNPFIYGVRPTPTPRPVTPRPTRPLVRRTPPPTPTQASPRSAPMVLAASSSRSTVRSRFRRSPEGKRIRR